MTNCRFHSLINTDSEAAYGCVVIQDGRNSLLRIKGNELSLRLLFLQHPFIMMHLSSIFRRYKTGASLWEANLTTCDKNWPALVFVSHSYSSSLCLTIKFCRMTLCCNTTVCYCWGMTVVTLSFCSSRWHRSSIFPKCFCKSCQFVFASPCQYLPRLHSAGYTRNPCGGLAYEMGKQMFGLLLLCQLGPRCKITHRLGPVCLHDTDLVSRLWFTTKWTQYFLFTAKSHQPAATRTTAVL